MDLSFFKELVIEYGYISMFIFNWILLFGMPLPNEVAAAFSGMLTEISYFKPVYAFISAYLGLITSNTFAYMIGRIFGVRLINRLYRTRFKDPIDRFNAFMEKRGDMAVSFSFFLPGFRWAMPYVVGANRFPFHRYAVFAYTAGFVWMMVYFNIGRTFPYAYESILENMQVFLVILSTVIVLVFAGVYFYQSRFRRN